MEPKISPHTRNCMNCYWFDFKPNHKPRTRACMYPENIEMRQIVIEVPSPSGVSVIKNLVCGMWKDCGMLERGLSKGFI